MVRIMINMHGAHYSRGADLRIFRGGGVIYLQAKIKPLGGGVKPPTPLDPPL